MTVHESRIRDVDPLEVHFHGIGGLAQYQASEPEPVTPGTKKKLLFSYKMRQSYEYDTVKDNADNSELKPENLPDVIIGLNYVSTRRKHPYGGFSEKITYYDDDIGGGNRLICYGDENEIILLDWSPTTPEDRALFSQQKGWRNIRRSAAPRRLK